MYERPELDRDYLTKWIEAEYKIWWLEVEDVVVEPLIEIKEVV